MVRKRLPLKRIRYYTMNSWNISKAPAYNMKIHNIIADAETRNKLYNILEYEDVYNYVNHLINEFSEENKYEWQAGFNGRSGGYLVLYKGRLNEDGTVYVESGRNIEDKDVPADVLIRFRKLALDIQDYAVYLAGNYEIEEVEVVHKEKVLRIK